MIEMPVVVTSYILKHFQNETEGNYNLTHTGFRNKIHGITQVSHN